MLLLDMAASSHPDRIAVQHAGRTLTYQQLLDAAGAGAAMVGDARHVAYLGPSHLAFPVALFAAAAARVPFLPLNYRLATAQVDALLSRHDDVVLVGDGDACEGLSAPIRCFGRDEFLAGARAGSGAVDAASEDDVAVLLYTSGTTAEPRAAVLRHRHLVSYVIGTVEFGAASEDDAALVSVPPYHVAGIANLLSNLYMGRRLVYLDQFDPTAWLELVRTEGVTHAMVVPTMLARIVDSLGDAGECGTPTLRSLSYGGARTPWPVLERALLLFGGCDFTNAYGLTETSSTIAVLGPDDHRAALSSEDPGVRARLSSAGQLLPGIEVEVRDGGVVLAPGEAGEVWVRGEQVSGQYLGRPSSLDEHGWFPTGDRGWVDADGYLFIEGRSDDTIIRGGENIAPAEIEEVLLSHPEVGECAVVGVPDDEWGQRIVAVVVRRDGSELDGDALREWCRPRLRSFKTPDQVEFRPDLPHTETGKLLRRFVLADVLKAAGES